MKSIFGAHSLLSRLGKDENATVLIQFTVYLVVIFGMIGLSIDGGRFVLVHNSLQDLADASALAGGVDLDSQTGARALATTDATNMAAKNAPRWFDTGGSTTVTTAFYSAISTGGDTAATGDFDAHYIKVTTSASGTIPTFLRAVHATTTNLTTATAMAFAGYQTCTSIQGYMCAANLSSATPGTGFFALGKASGGNGDWGDIDLPTGSISNYTDFFAQLSSNSCVSNSFHQHPGNGQHQATIDGLNVRMDVPQGSGFLSTAAPIVIDGYDNSATCNSNPATPDIGSGKSALSFDQTDSGDNGAAYDAYCNHSPAGGSCPLPRDRTLGNGVSTTDLQAYWFNHHGTSTLPAGVTTRYAAYQCELGAGAFAAVSGCAPSWQTDSLEPHAPVCSAATGDFTRRTLYMGIYDGTCPSGNSGPQLFFTRYAAFFMTEKVEKVSGKPNIYTELIGIFDANSAGSILHQVVQLVR